MEFAFVQVEPKDMHGPIRTGRSAMFRRLLDMIVQQVPESLSVCEFECPVTKCTTKIWSACRLRVPELQHGSSVVHFTALQRKTDALQSNARQVRNKGVGVI